MNFFFTFRYHAVALAGLICLFSFSCKKYDLDMRGHVDAYESANQRFEVSKTWNDNNPVRILRLTDSSYRLYFAGDCHFGTTANMQLMYNMALTEKADAIFLAGDLTTGHTDDYETLAQFLAANDSLPSYCAVGNHDLFFHGWPSFVNLFGSSAYPLILQMPDTSDLMLVLDTGSGSLGNDQYSWLEDYLRNERNKYRYCFVMTHENFYRTRFTTSTNPNVEEVLALMDLFTKYHVNLVVTGHEHTRNEEKFGETNYITLDAIQDIQKRPSWLELNVSSAALEWHFMEMLH